MKYLVDANVLSEPTKPIANERVELWLDENEAELVTSAVVMGEIWRGVDALSDGKKKLELIAWFKVVRLRVPSMEWSTDSAIIWAEMVNHVKRSGYTVGTMDST